LSVPPLTPPAFLPQSGPPGYPVRGGLCVFRHAGISPLVATVIEVAARNGGTIYVEARRDAKIPS
jgi:hypothetical protein